MRGMYRISLRTFLVVLTLALIWCGYQVNKAREQKVLVSIIELQGGDVHYDFQRRGPTEFEVGPEPKAPRWLRNLIGDEHFQAVVLVHLNADGTPLELDVFKRLTRMNELEILMVEGRSLPDEAAPHIGRMRGLFWLGLAYSNASDSWIPHVTKLRGLRHLTIVGTEISPDGVEELKRKLPNCRIVTEH